MAVVSHKLGKIYIGVPKTGSTSVLRSLHYADPLAKCSGGRHETALRARARDPGIWSRYETFAFVREPVEWLGSWIAFFGDSAANTKTPYDWMTDEDGEVIVDKIYRTEDMREFAAEIGAPYCHINVTPREPLDLTDSQMLEIRERFKREYDHYG